MSTVLEEVSSVIQEFQNELKSFAMGIRNSQPASAESQSDLVAKLDPIFDIDQRLQTAFKKVNEQQEYLTKKKVLEKELEEVRKQEDILIDEYFEAIISLKQEIKDDKHKLQKLKSIKENGIDLPAMTALAERLSLTCGPPDDWRPDLPLVLHKPPYPTEDLMRGSLLFQTMNVQPAHPRGEVISADVTDKGEKTARKNIVNQDHAENGMLLDLDLNPDLL